MARISMEKMVPREDAPSLSRLEPMRALVVDDDDNLLDLVGRMMEALGFWVDAADSGHSATHRLRQSQYDVVVTDLQMPEMNGYALAEWIKHQSEETKVIIMTGCHHSEVTDYMNTGIVDEWLFKPFGLRDLGTLVGVFA